MISAKLSHQLPPARSVIATIILPINLAAYIALLAWAQAGNTSWYVSNSPAFAAQVRLYQIIAIGTFATVTAISAFIIRPSISIAKLPALFWTFLILWYGISTLWSINPENTALYTCMLAALLTTAAMFWACVNIEAVGYAGTIGTVAAIVILFVSLPLTGRRLGGIEPNLLAHFGLAVLTLSYLTQHKARWVAVIIALALIMAVQARTVFISGLVFIVMWHFVARLVRTPAGLSRITVLTIVLVIAIAPLMQVIVDGLSKFSTDALNVNDLSRLGGSGFTGRQRLWDNAFIILNDHELYGFGFRTRETATGRISPGANAHSGVLNALLDTGAIGLFLFVATFFVTCRTILRRWTSYHQVEDRTAISFLVAMIPVLIVEPNYFNFAHPTSFLLLLFLGRYVLNHWKWCHGSSNKSRAPAEN